MNNHIPNHIGLIPDGGRRWAREHGVSLLESYQRTMQLITRFTTYMFERDVNALSIYLLSRENLDRKKEDVDAVVSAEIELLDDLLPNIINHYHIKVCHAGTKKILPTEFENSISEICGRTVANNGKTLYLLIGYNHLDEISAVATQPHFDADSCMKNLWVPQPLDIVCRTSGERRISGFLPIQSAYAELFFLEKHFNEVSDADFENILVEFSKRDRRFGK